MTSLESFGLWAANALLQTALTWGLVPVSAVEETTAALETTQAAEEASGLSLSTSESWGNPGSLERHFADHGADFGASSADEYASQASRFLQRSQAEGLPTKIDPRGTIRTYDPSTNEFGAFNTNGTTKTYFAPNPAEHSFPTNWDYWISQRGDKPWTP